MHTSNKNYITIIKSTLKIAQKPTTNTQKQKNFNPQNKNTTKPPQFENRRHTHTE